MLLLEDLSTYMLRAQLTGVELGGGACENKAFLCFVWSGIPGAVVALFEAEHYSKWHILPHCIPARQPSEA